MEETWETFRNVLDEAITKFVPSSTIRAANTPKWLTREIVKLVRKKKNALGNWQRLTAPWKI